MNENIAVLGGQNGDEGKARIIHAFAPDYDYIVRFSGSSNAGHTLYHNGTKIVRHLIPSADFSTSNKVFLGAGMVINPDELLTEVQETEDMFPGSASRITVDPDAFVIFSSHVAEDTEKNAHIGSTKKGVTPAYVDKIARRGIKIKDLLNGNSGLKADAVIAEIKNMGVQFKHVMELKDEFTKSKILFEGSQSILLDFNFGAYPYVTSGECGLGGIINAGFAQLMPSKVYGIIKAYSTKVGKGPFPTELSGTVAEDLRNRGGEYGATTGRPRRVGWLDLPALKYSIEKGGITNLIITKLDILNGFDKVPVCFEYEKSPICGTDFFNASPIFLNIPGWNNPRDFLQIKDFISAVEFYTKVKVSLISCGINKSDILWL